MNEVMNIYETFDKLRYHYEDEIVEFKKAENRLKELEEVWKGIQEARRQRQEEWERQWEERRTRDEG